MIGGASLDRRAFVRDTAALGTLASLVTLGGACSQNVEPRPDGVEWLSDEQAQTAARLVEVLLPGGSGFPAGTDLDLVADVDAALRRESPVLRAKFGDALLFLEWAPQFSMRFKPFSRLDAEARAVVFASYGTSRWGVKRAVYSALKGLFVFAYITHAEVWSGMGYDGMWITPAAAAARTANRQPTPLAWRGQSVTDPTARPVTAPAGATAVAPGPERIP